MGLKTNTGPLGLFTKAATSFNRLLNSTRSSNLTLFLKYSVIDTESALPRFSCEKLQINLGALQADSPLSCLHFQFHPFWWSAAQHQPGAAAKEDQERYPRDHKITQMPFQEECQISQKGLRLSLLLIEQFVSF